MTVRTNVPEAQVYVDNYEVGRTPVSTDFITTAIARFAWKDGYETQTVTQPVNALVPMAGLGLLCRESVAV
jgi:hypothetical protein